MTLYSLVLFVHITGVLALFACLSLELLALFRLQRASTLAEVRLWMESVQSPPLLSASSALAIFLSGVYLTKRMSAFGLAWTQVAIAALLLIAPFGALTAGRMRAIRQACGNEKTMVAELRRRLQDRLLKTSLGIRIAIFLGIVLLMAAKPDLGQSIGIVATSVVLGVLSSVIFWRRSGQVSARSTNLGN